MYSQEITRRHRAAIVLMLDRSASMQGRVRFGRMIVTKAEAVAMTANMLITELIDRCRRTDALRNYFDIAVVGYGNDNVVQLLSEDGFVSVEALSQRTPRMGRIDIEEELPDGTAAMVEHSRPYWVDIDAEGTTPMYAAMMKVRDMVELWCAKPENRESFPPIVINITDGEPTDCDDNELRDICAQVRRVATEDGETLLLNVHICTDWTLPSIVFPMPDDLIGAGRQARTLAECSSIMPSAFDDAIIELKGMGAVPPFYGMGYNASVIELLSIINIGSRSIINME